MKVSFVISLKSACEAGFLKFKKEEKLTTLYQLELLKEEPFKIIIINIILDDVLNDSLNSFQIFFLFRALIY